MTESPIKVKTGKRIVPLSQYIDEVSMALGGVILENNHNPEHSGLLARIDLCWHNLNSLSEMIFKQYAGLDARSGHVNADCTPDKWKQNGDT